MQVQIVNTYPSLLVGFQTEPSKRCQIYSIGFLFLSVAIYIELQTYWEVRLKNEVNLLTLLIAKFCGCNPCDRIGYSSLSFESEEQAKHFAWLVTSWGLETITMDYDDIPF